MLYTFGRRADGSWFGPKNGLIARRAYARDSPVELDYPIVRSLDKLK
jgi:hypothetical protein